MLPLRQEYERTARVAAVLFEHELDVRKDVSRLHMAADRGLRGPNFSIEDGRANLTTVQEHITDFAIEIRDARLSG